MSASLEELDVLLETYKEIKQEQALLKYCVADYIITHTANYADENDAKDARKEARKVRDMWTGQSQAKDDKTLTKEQILEYQEMNQTQGTTFLEYVNTLKL